MWRDAWLLALFIAAGWGACTWWVLVVVRAVLRGMMDDANERLKQDILSGLGRRRYGR